LKTKQLTTDQLKETAKILRDGGIVAVMTDTVFGLAVKYPDIKAYQALVNAKGREEHKPFPFMISALDQLSAIALANEKGKKLAARWFPGALTLVFKKHPQVEDFYTDNKDTIAVRMPKDDFLLSLGQAVGTPLLLTSANLAGQPPALNSGEVLQQLDGRIDAVVLGSAQGNKASTIVDVSGEEFQILRQGGITLEEIKESLVQTIALGADHGAFTQKNDLKKHLEERGIKVLDFGCFSEESCDYPDFAYPAAKAVAEKKADLGIVLCGSGIGASITANKVKGIRCALVDDPKWAKITREHNDSNVLAMGGRVLDSAQMIEIADIWLDTPFSGDPRHQRRIDKIREAEVREEE
jgi:tRNA threonylcarbamoyl adenosine modification protein (Sua5/YciO/YrdC/YwlC family)